MTVAKTIEAIDRQIALLAEFRGRFKNGKNIHVTEQEEYRELADDIIRAVVEKAESA